MKQLKLRLVNCICFKSSASFYTKVLVAFGSWLSLGMLANSFYVLQFYFIKFQLGLEILSDDFKTFFVKTKLHLYIKFPVSLSCFFCTFRSLVKPWYCKIKSIMFLVITRRSRMSRNLSCALPRTFPFFADSLSGVASVDWEKCNFIRF